jgi:hypothetical protein
VGERIGGARLDFNGSLRIEERAERLSGEGGALFLREIDERLGFVKELARRLRDSRDQEKITHPLPELLRTALLLLAQGWRDQDDADTIRNDPVFRLSVSTRRGISPLLSPERESDEPKRIPDGLASQPTLSRLVRMLADEGNRRVVRDSLLDLVVRRVLSSRNGQPLDELTIDVDSLGIQVHGQQAHARHNPHLGGKVFHPLVASSAELGDILDVLLRPGNVHTAADAVPFIERLLERVEGTLCRKASLRIDAGFPDEKLMAAMEARGTRFVARIRNNAILERMAKPHLVHPPGRRPDHEREWTYESTYQAKDWTRPRRVVLVVVERPGQLWLDRFWLITNWTLEEKGAVNLVALYRQRGTAEGHQGEWKDVLAPKLSSINRPKDHYRGLPIEKPIHIGPATQQNEVTLLLNALAYNLMHVGRTLVEGATRQGWGLQRFRDRILRVAVRVLLHANRAVIVVGESGAHWWSALWGSLRNLRPVPA